MTTEKKLWTVNEIKDANQAKGGHWFDPGTMRSFGTTVLAEVYQGPGGVYFVTGDRQYDGTRGFTVRTFDPETGGVGSAKTGCGVGELKRSAAVRRAKELALGSSAGEVRTTREEFAPVSILDQFVADVRAHARADALRDVCRELIRLAGKHHRGCERDCNEGGDHATRYEEPIRALALSVGCAGVHFQGDPRGATVKLLFRDGATNDFGSEGWCVPTSLTDD